MNIMRYRDLPWEWNSRICKSCLGTGVIIQRNWKTCVSRWTTKWLVLISSWKMSRKVYSDWLPNCMGWHSRKTRRYRFTTRKFRHTKCMMQKETSRLCYIRISSRVKESNLELGWMESVLNTAMRRVRMFVRRLSSSWTLPVRLIRNLLCWLLMR